MRLTAALALLLTLAALQQPVVSSAANTKRAKCPPGDPPVIVTMPQNVIMLDNRKNRRGQKGEIRTGHDRFMCKSSALREGGHMAGTHVNKKHKGDSDESS